MSSSVKKLNRSGCNSSSTSIFAPYLKRIQKMRIPILGYTHRCRHTFSLLYKRKNPQSTSINPAYKSHPHLKSTGNILTCSGSTPERPCIFLEKTLNPFHSLEGRRRSSI